MKQRTAENLKYYFDALVSPKSIAVIGAREKPNTAGSIVFNNLLNSDYKGKIYPVNPKHPQIFNQKSYVSVEEIQEQIDLAIIVTPAIVVPDVLKQCVKKGISFGIIISAGFSEIGASGKELENKIQKIVKQHDIHILGPNCLGILSPHINMNATFGNLQALPGNIALISQSGALCAAILDWAKQQKIGFSSVISIGNALDIGFAELLNYFESDPHTTCIFLYIEGVKNPKLFLKNLNLCSKKKPVIILKAGLSEHSSKALFSHTGALIGKDDVFNAAIKQSGAIRVDSIRDFFNAAEIFSKNIQLKETSLTIISNGGGAGVLAADEASKLKVNLLNLSHELMLKLDNLLPKHWSHGNPIDIIGDADPSRFEKILNVLLNDKKNGAILVILVPVAMSNPLQTANILIIQSKKTNTPILTCWMGRDQSFEARMLFHEHNIPTFETPEDAVFAHALLVQQHNNQKNFIGNHLDYKHKNYSVKTNTLSDIKVSEIKIKDSIHIIQEALLQNRRILNLIESKTILNNFGIPIAESYHAKSSDECIKIAEKVGFPLVMKILSPDVTHKRDIGGVQLNITTDAALIHAFNNMIKIAKEKIPNINIEGITLEKMYKHPNNRELMIGILKDPIFGSVISFGAGGTIVDVMQDRAIALPPLTIHIIENLIFETKISKILGEFRGMPSIQHDSLKQILLRVSEMACALPQIIEMDINPLIANEDEIIAVDARIVIGQDENMEIE